MFEKIKNLFHQPRLTETDVIEIQFEQAGADLDNALYVYSQLLDNNCRDSLALDAAHERIDDLREQYRKLKEEKVKTDEQEWRV